jgi:inorganic pyrophosphatase/solute carrier family 25 iron transporter 28/37
MIPAISLYYMTYEWSKVYLAKNHQFFKKSDGICFFVAGIMAEAISCIFWLPIDIVKERLQV